MALVSIIVPVFNTQNYLAKCIESCLNQTFKDIEIILIDDKSTDESVSIIASYNDSRIVRINNQKNLGTFLARAEGIKVARGKYMLFLDADDYLLCDTIETLLALANKTHADILNFGIIHEPFNRFATLPKIHDEPLHGADIAKRIIVDDFCYSWLNLCGRMYESALVKKAQEKLFFIDRHIISSEDTILFFVICLLAKKSVGMKKNLYIYCNNSTSIMRSEQNERLWKQIHDREYLKSALDVLGKDDKLCAHPYFLQAKKKIRHLLDYFICFSKKFLASKDVNAIIPSYITYSLMSMTYMPRWQTMVKLLIFFGSFGRKKM